MDWGLGSRAAAEDADAERRIITHHKSDILGTASGKVRAASYLRKVL
jgi:hypothetical protein